MTEEKSLFRETDDAVRREARKLFHEARFASLATLDPETGYPAASRILIGTDYGGAPVTLISQLASHTKALIADSRCSLMVGEPGKGDPLASPRIMFACNAEQIDRNSEFHRDLSQRFIRKHTKSKLYVEFFDFSFFRFKLVSVLFNGGFGRAFQLDSADFVSEQVPLINSFEDEHKVISNVSSNICKEFFDKLNETQGGEPKNWEIRNIDANGIDLRGGDSVIRIEFLSKLSSFEDVNDQILKLMMHMF